MENEKQTLYYSLSEGLKGRKDSAAKRRYIAHIKSDGCFRDADLWEEMAKATGRDAEYIQYLALKIRDKRVDVAGLTGRLICAIIRKSIVRIKEKI